MRMLGTVPLWHGRENFATTDWIKVPKIWWDYTTSEVLTMEYCPGVKINRIAELDRLGLDRQRLARLSVESYLQQLVRSQQRSSRLPSNMLSTAIIAVRKGVRRIPVSDTQIPTLDADRLVSPSVRH